MKLKRLYLENFRSYKDLISVDFENITTFIGKNDAGKSTILEALEIFFNNDIVKIDRSDANVFSNSKKVTIACDFTELPNELVLDSGENTSLKEEYLLIDEDTMRIKKTYDCSKSKPSEDIYIVANHPTADGFENLLSLKEKELQKMVKERQLNCSKKGNPTMRKALWESADDLKISEVEISLTKSKEDVKDIWSKIESHLPTYALFQSDRSSSDSDGEVQNPMKVAIQEAISEVQEEIQEIQEKVREKATEIANQTHEALQAIDPSLANELTPTFATPAVSKWNSLFSIAMDTDAGISLNKRGSGVRRMILVGFFKAEAERKAKKSNKKDIIYAIEEPETAQHPNNQKILINSFLELSETPHCQIILTTHSPGLAQELPTDSIRFVNKDEESNALVQNGTEAVIAEVVKTLGILPNPEQNIKLVIYVEGPTDVIALKCFSRCLREKYPDVINLSTDKRILLIPSGGSILKYWVDAHYLENLNCPCIHIYDNDVTTYQKSIDKVNARNDGSWGVLTKKYEIENYLHYDAIKSAYDVDVDTDAEKVPERFGKVYAIKKKLDKPMGANKSKLYLRKAFDMMTYQLLMERDTEGEIKSWFDKMKAIVERP
ncbi:AAA family ATPase [Prevotella corporis]|uniref:AAA family ATPase n=1 Tax=Prevotella corporis TaxID=28128 RepID=UPI0023F28448|nr:AAA family ATPase [Prevotella corporis]